MLTVWTLFGLAVFICFVFRLRRHLAEIPSVAFFHPYCCAGGGGERVLFRAICNVRKAYGRSQLRIVVYTGDYAVKKKEILRKASCNFDITIEPEDVDFVFLRSRRLLEANLYPVFTMMFQSLASIVVGFEALLRFTPNIYYDSMGYAFTYPMFKILAGCVVGCYIHYPTISCDMLTAVDSPSFNNRAIFVRHKTLRLTKLAYYRLFAHLYGLMGRFSNAVAVNSTWTRDHIASIFQVERSDCTIIYPPCNVTAFKDEERRNLYAGLRDNEYKNEMTDIPESQELGAGAPMKTFVSIGQFRPEKNHMLQLKAFRKFLEGYSEDQRGHFQLLMIGGCREGSDDESRVIQLKYEAKLLQIDQFLQIRTNLSFQSLLQEMQLAYAFIHTMKNEHFGISIVEALANGLPCIAHDSGGPKMDILKGGAGLLADDEHTYAEAMNKIVNMSVDELHDMEEIAKENIERFSDQAFDDAFLEHFHPLYNDLF